MTKAIGNVTTTVTALNARYEKQNWLTEATRHKSYLTIFKIPGAAPLFHRRGLKFNIKITCSDKIYRTCENEITDTESIGAGFCIYVYIGLYVYIYIYRVSQEERT